MNIKDIIVNVNPTDKTDKAIILKTKVYHPTFKIYLNKIKIDYIKFSTKFLLLCLIYRHIFELNE